MENNIELDNKITDYIKAHYATDDYTVEKWDVKPLRQSTINSPFENICDNLICITWASPAHFGCSPAIYWNYVTI